MGSDGKDEGTGKDGGVGKDEGTGKDGGAGKDEGTGKDGSGDKDGGAGKHGSGEKDNAGGLRIRSPYASIELGDVKLFRSGAESLTVEGSVEVSGSLEAEAIKVNGLSLNEI